MPNHVDTHPPVITPQGQNNTTWTAPPFNVEFTVPGLYKFNADKNPDHAAFVYYDDEHDKEVIVYHKDVYPAICRAAGIVSQHAPALDASGIIGILAAAGKSFTPQIVMISFD